MEILGEKPVDSWGEKEVGTHVMAGFGPGLQISGQNNGGSEDEGHGHDGGGHQSRDPHGRAHPFLVELKSSQTRDTFNFLKQTSSNLNLPII